MSLDSPPVISATWSEGKDFEWKEETDVGQNYDLYLVRDFGFSPSTKCKVRTSCSKAEKETETRICQTDMSVENSAKYGSAA